MSSKKKPDNPIQPHIENTYHELLEDGEKQLYEVDKENNKQLDRAIKYISRLFLASFAIEGVLKPNSTEKRKMEAEFMNLITNIGLRVGNKEKGIIEKILKSAAKEVNNQVQFILYAGVDKKIKYLPLASDQIDKLILRRVKNMTYSDRIWRNQALLVTKLNNELKLAIKKGKSYEKVARDIKKAFGVKTYEAHRIARTEIGAIQSRISAQIYQQCEVVTGVQWDSKLLSNTKPYDASLHGLIWNTSEKNPIPVEDTHPNCKCMLIPVVPDWKPEKNFEKEYNKWKKENNIS